MEIKSRGVFGIVLKGRNKVLLVKRRDNGIYNLPGGKIEKGETRIEALKREIKEEVGAEVSKIKFFKRYYTVYKDLVYTYLVKLKPFKFKRNKEAVKIAYFNYKKLPKIYNLHSLRIYDFVKRNKLNV